MPANGMRRTAPSNASPSPQSNSLPWLRLRTCQQCPLIPLPFTKPYTHPPQKDPPVKLTDSPRNASPSEQIDFLLKKHTSTDLAEEGFDMPASVQLRYQAGSNDIKIETHKIDFRHVVGPAKASLRPLKPQFTLRKNASTQDLLTHTASLRERKPNPPVLSKKQSAARLIPTRKATESEIATISKIVAKSERTPRTSPAPSNSLRTVLNHVRNLTRSNSTKASPLANPTS
ncbi:hypothetical protein DSO57_1012611 [Entomophthora muscae]|uniref:Uncharacterized protein n=1 Tax=Entomophthora muscae TaxID=34485 RepID=A0ACC2RKN7_9FUNG|nr:hypothetical protein DSO57_1012611 [Entomophthora muscae]